MSREHSIAAAAVLALLGSTPALGAAAPASPKAQTVIYTAVTTGDSAASHHPAPRFLHRSLTLGARVTERPRAASDEAFEALVPAPKGSLAVGLVPVEPGARPFVIDRATGRARGLFEGYAGGSFFGWHPDGERFLFWIDGVGLLLVNASTGEPLRLAHPTAPVQGAALSPDGATVAFITTHLPASAGALFTVSSHGGEPRALFDTGAVSYLYPQAFSPDGRRLLYYGSCEGAAPKAGVGGPLCVADLTTGERRALALPFAAYQPHWSPDGTRIVATGRAGGETPCSRERNTGALDDACLFEGYAIYTEELTTGALDEVARGIAPVVSPDGKSLAYLSHESGNPEVWTLDLASGRERQLTNTREPKSPYGQLQWLTEVK